MAGVRQGFFNTSSQPKNEERKQNVISSNLTDTSNQHFSQQYQNKQQKITNTAMTPTSEEKPRKQVKSALHHEVSEFNPFGLMSMGQLIRVVINLQEEVKTLYKEDMKLTEFINNGFQDMLDLRMANQKREIDALQNTTASSSTRRTLKFRKYMKKMLRWRTFSIVKKANLVNKTQENTLWELKSKTTKNLDLRKKVKKKCYYGDSAKHFHKNYLKFQNFKKQY